MAPKPYSNYQGPYIILEVCLAWIKTTRNLFAWHAASLRFAAARAIFMCTYTYRLYIYIEACTCVYELSLCTVYIHVNMRIHMCMYMYIYI